MYAVPFDASVTDFSEIVMEGMVEMQQTTQRPTGITILAVLAAIGGVFGLLGGFVLMGAGGLIGAGMAVILGIVTIVIAIGDLAFAYGAWSLQPWAWMLGIGLQAANILFSILAGILNNSLGSQILSIIISGIIIYYLMTPPIKKAFGQPA